MQKIRNLHLAARKASLKYRWWIIGAVYVSIFLLITPTILVKYATRHDRYDANKISLSSVPYRPVGLVFGAGVYDGDKPSYYLANRVKTAVDLYKAGRVGKLVMSGDNSNHHYDEPTAMRKYALSLGMNPDDIVLDYAGYSTYDSCYRAKAIFDIKKVTVVTQGYHLPRAMYTCRGLGIDAIGVAAARGAGKDVSVPYITREFLSTDKAMVQLLFKPKPAVLGSPEPIIVAR